MDDQTLDLLYSYGKRLHLTDDEMLDELSKVLGSFTLVTEFSKVDNDKRQVFGWASVSELGGERVVDHQRDSIAPEELEKAAYDYVRNSRVGGIMHQRVGKSAPKQVGTLIESMVFTPEKLEVMGLSKSAVPTGWWTGFKVMDDDIWEGVKKGKWAGFSVHGVGKRLPRKK